MPWSKPDFVEISLCMEVTGYVNTDDDPTLLVDEAALLRPGEQQRSKAASSTATDH